MKRDFQVSTPAPTLLTAAGLFLIFITFYWDGVSDLAELWNSDKTYSHGFLVAAIIIYLLTLQNKSLSQLRLQPTALFLFPLAINYWLMAISTTSNTKHTDEKKYSNISLKKHHKKQSIRYSGKKRLRQQ